MSFIPEEAHHQTAFYNYVRTNPGPSDREGISVFYKDESGAVFHTYSCFARGIDMMNATYQYLDLVPKSLFCNTGSESPLSAQCDFGLFTGFGVPGQNVS